MVDKTDERYGKGEASIAEGDTLDPALKLIRDQVKKSVGAENFEIPLLPTAATQVLQMANNPNAGFGEIEKLVKHDQVIAAQIIKTANSPFYRGRAETTSLQSAMSRIGLKQLKAIVFSLSINSTVFKIKGYEELMERLWDHSVACAAIAQMIAQRTGVEPDQAFLAGLLHDIGKPVLVNEIAKLEKIQQKNIAAGQAKKNLLEGIHDVLLPLVFSEYHAVVGGFVAKKWQIPKGLIEVIIFHHDYEKAQANRQMTLVVHLSNLLCHHFGFGHESDPVILHHLKPFQELSLDQAKITKLETDIPEAVDGLLAAM